LRAVDVHWRDPEAQPRTHGKEIRRKTCGQLVLGTAGGRWKWHHGQSLVVCGLLHWEWHEM